MIELPMGEQQIVDAGTKTKRLGVFFVQFAPTFKQAAVDQNSAFATSRGRPRRTALSRQTYQHGLEKLLGITTFSYRTEPTSRHAEKIIFNARGS